VQASLFAYQHVHTVEHETKVSRKEPNKFRHQWTKSIGHRVKLLEILLCERDLCVEGVCIFVKNERLWKRKPDLLYVPVLDAVNFVHLLVMWRVLLNEQLFAIKSFEL
jgi:hypothetical protein